MASLLSLVCLATAGSCGFPDHSFINDDEFYGAKDSGTPEGGSTAKAGGANAGGANAGGGGAGAGGTAAGGRAAGGNAGSPPDAGAGGDGSGGAGAGGTRDGGVTGKTEAGPLDPDGGSGGAVGSGGSGGSAEAGPEGGAVEAGPTCGPGLDLCFGVCVDLLADDTHCGTCSVGCVGAQVCTAGVCKAPCAPGLSDCGGSCVDTDTDENHCGGCNRTPCAPGDVCEGGSCVADCGSLTRCGARICVDTTSDDTHCGNCTTNCRTISQVCSAGTCSPSCVFPFIPCGNTCVNPQTDDLNCNGCGKPCQVGENCIGSSCIKLVENCQNGIDDDEDLLADCLDPDCTTRYTCASTPAGWTGPVALWSGTAGSAPSCASSGGYPTAFLSANSGLVVPAYSCPACNCAPAAGAYCDDPTVEIDTSTDCVSTSPWVEKTLSPTSCSSFSLCCATNASAQSMKLTQPAASYMHGSCTASQTAPQFPAAGWSNEVRACGAAVSPAGGCNGGQCVPKPTAPFGSTLCIFKVGLATCDPGSDYPVQRPGAAQQYYQTVQEGRSCTACSCSPGCGGTVTTYTDTACTTGATVLNLTGSNTCTTIPVDPTQSGGGNKSDTRSYKFVNPGPVCGSVPSVLSGAPTPQSPVTICCQSP